MFSPTLTIEQVIFDDRETALKSKINSAAEPVKLYLHQQYLKVLQCHHPYLGGGLHDFLHGVSYVSSFMAFHASTASLRFS